MALDIFENDAFSMVSLTAAINHDATHVPSRLRSSGLFMPKGVMTTKIAIEEKHGKLSLIQTSERGSDPSTSENSARKLRDFRTVHLSRLAKIMADEVVGVRAFGSETGLESVMGIYTERRDEKIQEMDLTIERLMLGALTGRLLDADDTLIYNFFAEFGVTKPADVTIAFSGITQANADKMIINQAAVALKRSLKKALRGLPAGSMRIHALCGDNFFDALVHNAETIQSYKNYTAAASLRDFNHAHETFRYGGVIWENYEGTDDGRVAIGTDECRFFVEGVPGLFEIYFAPGDTVETVNTRGLPLYAFPHTDPKGKFFEVEIQSNPLPICTKPATLVKGLKG